MGTQACRLTTIDNPYNPFDDFLKWNQFDVLHEYNSCEYLARVAQTSDSNSDQENNEIINNAIDEIIKFDFLNVGYKKVEPKETD